MLYVFRMAFDHKQLRAFLAIVDRGSLNRAAQQIFTTQPTLSRTLADMERRLGQRLFERTAKGMMLTEAGDTLVPHARLLLHEMEAASDALQALHGLKRGTVRIGAVPTISRGILADAIPALLDTAPGLNINLLERADNELFSALLRREVDIVIAGSSIELDGVIAINECRYDDSFSTFCSVDHPLARRRAVGLQDVIGEQWAFPALGPTPRNIFDRLINESGAPSPSIVVQTASLDAIVSIVGRSRLLSWLPVPLLHSAKAAGHIHLLDIPELRLKRRFLVYRRAKGLLPAPAQQLLKLLPIVGRG